VSLTVLHLLKKSALLLALTSLVGAACACPVTASPNDPASFSAAVTPKDVHPGEIATIVISTTIDAGWHLYGLTPVPPPGPATTSMSVSGAGLSSAGDPSENTPTTAFDSNFGKSVTYHVSHATFYLPVKIMEGQSGQAAAAVSVHYQTCNDRICLPPRSKQISVPITVTPGPIRKQYTTVRSAPVNDSGLLWFLAAAFGAGLLSLITPCVFPLIPITLSSFVKQADGNKRRLVMLSSIYSLGIVLLYVTVGVAATLLLGASGISRLATNPWVNLFAFLVFLVFALSFFETIQISLPGNLGAMQSAAKKQGGWLGLAALGTVFVLASFTCTAPFVGTLLVTAAGGSLLRPILGMLTFSVAFVSPFLLLSLFPQWISRIPKSGIWLARVKATLGFIEIAASLKFLSNSDLVWQWKILTEPVLLAAWALIFFLTALYLAGVLKIGIVAELDDNSKPVTPARIAFVGLFSLISLYCFWGLSGRSISPYIAAYLPPDGYGGNGPVSGSTLPWLSNYDSALAVARAESKPLLIDFTGYTCTNCRLNEKQVFPTSPVQSELSKYVLVQLYTDGGTDATVNENLEINKFGDAALPLYGVINAQTGAVVEKTAGVQSVSGFTTFLQNGHAAAPAAETGSWAPYSPTGITGSASQNRPAIIDFTANWCTNCKAIEKTVFTNPSVTAKLSSFDTYRCDMTDYYSPANSQLQKKYSILSLPAIVFLDKSGKEVPGTRVTGLVSVKQFLTTISTADK
jgi:thiol:disulfide interchange protein DsbD